MLFDSIQFIIFLPCVIILYYLLPHKIRWILLLGASYYFYMVWRPEYIILIIVSTLVDYFAGLMMEKQASKKKRKALLLLSLFVNLGLLFVFKYFNFFNQELGRFYSLVSNNEYPIAGLNLILPMGISFYTFQTLSYTIDVYRGTRKAERHIGYFASYVTYFPQLVAGPIERSDRLLPQLRQKHKFDYENTMSALMRILWGFFKKIVIADRVAIIVNTIYGDLPSYSGIYLIVATLGFAIQIYADFSAYSDIAIGSAKLMGIDLMENFKMPYFSKSMSEFWSRWHISLSSWFKDYLYIPLGGSRVGKKWRRYANVMIVFLVSGFWHGANWTFLIWGFLHGFYQIVERLLSDLFKKIKMSFELPNYIKRIITFALVLFAWVFFRADNISDAYYVITHSGFSNVYAVFSPSMYGLGLDRKDFMLLIFSVIFLTITDALRYKRKIHSIVNAPYFVKGVLCIILLLFVIVFSYHNVGPPSEFIYFQF